MEKEIYLISSFYLVATFVLLVSGTKMYLVFRKKKKSDTIRYFFYGFIFIAIYLLTRSLPEVIIKDPQISLAVVSLFKPLLLVGGIFFCLIPLRLINSRIIERFYIIAMTFVVIISTLLNFIGLTEGGADIKANDYYFTSSNYFINYSSNIVNFFFAISLIFATVFYFQFAKKQRKNEIAFGRSIMIGMGCLFFLLAVIFDYFFLFYLSYESIFDVLVKGESQIIYGTGRFILSETAASLSFILAAVCLVSSVNYKGERAKKITSNKKDKK